MRRRCPLVLQAEQAECGLASLAMIAGYFGHRLQLSSIRRRFAAINDGPTLRSILTMAAALGLIPRPVRLELDDLRRLTLPLNFSLYGLLGFLAHIKKSVHGG